MRIVGAAFPRTGTVSVKYALERLGVAPSYHMHEVFLNPGHEAVWDAAWHGSLPDWPAFLAGYEATLDGPACLHWEQLSLAFPEASILLLRRGPDEWYSSVGATVYPIVTARADADSAMGMVKRVLFDGFFSGRFETGTTPSRCSRATVTR